MTFEFYDPDIFEYPIVIHPVRVAGTLFSVVDLEFGSTGTCGSSTWVTFTISISGYGGEENVKKFVFNVPCKENLLGDLVLASRSFRLVQMKEPHLTKKVAIYPGPSYTGKLVVTGPALSNLRFV